MLPISNSPTFIALLPKDSYGFIRFSSVLNKLIPICLPNLLADEPNGIWTFPKNLCGTVAQSPTLHIFLIDVLPNLSTTIAPFFNLSSLVSWKISVFGIKPIVKIRASILSFLFVVIISLTSPFSTFTSVNLSEKYIFTFNLSSSLVISLLVSLS